jgi:hypothetical protein
MSNMKSIAFVPMMLALVGCLPAPHAAMNNVCLAAASSRQKEQPSGSEVYEMYCWRTSQGTWRFSVLPNTNREKTIEEVFQNPNVVIGIDALRRRLQTFKVGTRIVILTELRAPGSMRPATGSERLRVPPRRMLDDLRKSVANRKIEISS